MQTMSIWLGSILVRLEITEILEGNWTSFKDVLVEIIGDQPESLDSSATGSDEYLAWVNSCPVTDTEILEGNWTYFKDVFVEIIGDQPESLDSSATGSDDFAGGTEIKIITSIEEAEAAKYSGRTDGDHIVIPINGDTETNTNDLPTKRRTCILPTYNEDERKREAFDLGLQLSLSADKTNSSTVDIFRVWDMDIPAEENDLVKQSNKAIAETETSFQSMPSAFDDSTAERLER